jgi:hypothetical protein
MALFEEDDAEGLANDGYWFSADEGDDFTKKH